ncbi:MAG: LysM peptidoglycan-binding domain-containing protein [Pseudomonadota bacterium]|nr:LysM peptidoglycan-binding domain-containing protein [Pseudomonadota bacterium]
MQRVVQKYGWAIALVVILALVVLGVMIIVSRAYDELAEQSVSSEEKTQNAERNGDTASHNVTLAPSQKPPESNKKEESPEEKTQTSQETLLKDSEPLSDVSGPLEKNKAQKKQSDQAHLFPKINPTQDSSTQPLDESISTSPKVTDSVVNRDNLLLNSKEKDIALDVATDESVNELKSKETGSTSKEKSVNGKQIKKVNEPQLDSEATSNSEERTKEKLASGSKEVFNLKKKNKRQDNQKVESDKNSEEELSVDVLRVDKEGDAVIAGKTTPNSKVEVLSNDEVVIETESDSEGNFVAMGKVKSMDSAQTLTLRSEKEELADETKIKNAEKTQKPEKNTTNLTDIDSDEWIIAENIFVILPSNLFESDISINEQGSDPIIVQSDSDEIKIVQNKSVASVKKITIDSISYSDLGEAILTGRAQPDYKVLIYVDDQFVDSSDVGASGGWSSELTGLRPGVYKLRLDEVDEQGVVRSRIETPFKKVSPDILMNMVSGSITVQPGNSLWRIARRIFGRGIKYIEIYEKNSDLIKDPDLIYPGQVFAIPTKL